MKDRGAVLHGRDAITTTFGDLRAGLVRAVRRMIGANNVEDIVQETFLRAYEAAERQEIRHPRSFMYTTAKNLALNHIAKADNKLTDSVGTLEELDLHVHDRASDMESDFESKERFLAFCRAVERLPLQCRRVFVMKRVYGLSQRDIADRLGISENTVEKQAGKGLAMCAEIMGALGHPIDGHRRPAPERLRRREQGS